MTLKEIKPKYEQLRIFIDKEEFSLVEIPQYMKYNFALSMYADRKVLVKEDLDDEKVTEIIIESEEQFKKREKTEN